MYLMQYLQVLNDVIPLTVFFFIHFCFVSTHDIIYSSLCLGISISNVIDGDVVVQIIICVVRFSE
jgi:hypothetical protein